MKSRVDNRLQLNVSPDIEMLINKRLSTGSYESVEDVLRRALQAPDAEESWTEDERRALAAHIEEGYQQAEHGELIDGVHARREIQAMKEHWHGCRHEPVAWPLPPRSDYSASSFLDVDSVPQLQPDTKPLQVVAVLHGKRNIREVLKEPLRVSIEQRALPVAMRSRISTA